MINVRYRTTTVNRVKLYDTVYCIPGETRQEHVKVEAQPPTQKNY